MVLTVALDGVAGGECLGRGKTRGGEDHRCGGQDFGKHGCSSESQRSQVIELSTLLGCGLVYKATIGNRM